MPDSPPNPDAGPPPPEADELAKGVVGAPIRCFRCVVDDEGLHARRSLFHGPIDLPWSDVTAVYAEGISLVVEGRHGEGEPRPLFDICCSSGAKAAVLAAWDEYAGRRLERDGLLAGAWSKVAASWHIACAIYGVLLLVLAIAVACTPPTQKAFYSVNPIEWNVIPVTRSRWIGFGIAVASFTLGGVALVARTSWRWRRASGVGQRWSRWEVTREGIAFWPDGKRVVLAPGPGDRITPQEALVGGELVPLLHMAFPLASRLVMALGERAGSRLHRSRSFWLVPGLLLCGPLVLGTVALSWHKQCRDWSNTVAPLIVLAMIVGIEIAIRAARWRKYLFHGRAMLERLGW